MNTFLFFRYRNRMLYFFFFLTSQREQILKTEYKHGQYCTPLSQSDGRYFSVEAIIKVMTKIIFYLLKFLKSSPLYLWVNKVIVFKNFKSFLSLFEIDRSINEILFWPMLLFLKGISKTMCEWVICDALRNLVFKHSWRGATFSKIIQIVPVTQSVSYMCFQWGQKFIYIELWIPFSNI